MGIRIEIVLFITIIVIVAGSLTIKLNNDANKQQIFTKELEFTDTTFTEVNTEKLLGKAYGTYGMRDDGVLTMDNLTYQADNIESLVANKGTYMGDIIYIEGDVVMHDTNGYMYETQQAEYNQKTEILNITAPFVATKDKDIIKGDTFTYNTQTKEAYGTKIDAVIYTIEK